MHTIITKYIQDVYKIPGGGGGPARPRGVYICILFVFFTYIFLYNNIFDKSTDSEPNREPPYQFEPSDRYVSILNDFHVLHNSCLHVSIFI